MAAKLPDLKTLVQAGIDPKTGLPIKAISNNVCDCDIKNGVLAQLMIVDEQDAINRYKWYNLPNGLDGQLIERILYYKGQAAFFYMESNDTFYFLPYALSGGIDVYGRFLGITPLPFNGTSQTNEKGEVKPWIQGLRKIPVLDIMKDIDPDTFRDGCVILHDYSKGISETNIDRATIQLPLLNVMADCLPMARTSLIANSGVKGVRVNSEEDASAVTNASNDIYRSSITGNMFVPIVSSIEFQELTDGTALKSEEYLLFLQALDNYRLSLYGLDTGGLFQKKSHMLQSEQEMNAGHAKLVYDDGLVNRQKFCNIVNSIWGLGIWCESSESALGVEPDMEVDNEQQQTDNDNQEDGGESDEL